MTTLSVSPTCISAHHRAASYGASPCRAASAVADSVQASFSSAPELSRPTAETALELQAPKAELQAPKIPPHRSRFHVLDDSEAKPIPVFVYGSLLPGLHNNRLLKNADFLGYRKSEAKFEMFSLGCYPAVCGEGTRAISGALYHVDRATLGRLDQLEGHPGWYQRQLTELEPFESGLPQRAWMYVMPRTKPELCTPCAALVESGDWFDYYKHPRQSLTAAAPHASTYARGDAQSPWALAS